MFDIVFGATLRLHITIIHLVIKYLNLEKCRGKATVRLGQHQEVDYAGRLAGSVPTRSAVPHWQVFL